MVIFHRNLSLLFPFFLTLITLHQSSAIPLSLGTLPTFKSLQLLPVKTVHDVLPEFGFPKGLLPDAVKSYSLSDNGDFQVELERPCYVHFDDVVYYDKKINGKLKFGSISDVSGIQAKKSFLWVPITGIVSDVNSGFIEFNVGFLSKKLPAEQFQKIPICMSKSCGNRKSGELKADESSVILEVEIQDVMTEFETESVSVDTELKKLKTSISVEDEKSVGPLISEAQVKGFHMMPENLPADQLTFTWRNINSGKETKVAKEDLALDNAISEGEGKALEVISEGKGEAVNVIENFPVDQFSFTWRNKNSGKETKVAKEDLALDNVIAQGEGKAHVVISEGEAVNVKEDDGFESLLLSRRGLRF